MNTRVRVPIRIRPSLVAEQVFPADVPEVAEATPPVMDWEVVPHVKHAASSVRPDMQHAMRNMEYATRPAQEPESELGPEEEESLEMWRDRALRLQAEMENFRKRQQRLADERINTDRERLLRAFLSIADDLERALKANGTVTESLRQGVDLTYQSMQRLLGQEGAELIQAEGQPFDPAWHEAVGTVPHQHTDIEPDTVAEVVQPGYRLRDRLLRPARVIVAT